MSAATSIRHANLTATEVLELSVRRRADPIATKAREYVKARWRNDGTAGAHFRALAKLVRDEIRRES